MPSPDQFPPPTWPDAVTPTVRELRKWLHTFTPEHDARIAADMIAGMLADEQRLHQMTRTELRDALADLAAAQRRYGRYRAAWMAARRRSDQWRRITDALVRGQMADEPEA